MQILLNIAPYALTEAERHQIRQACPGAEIECAPASWAEETDRIDGARAEVLVTEQVPRDLAPWPRLRLVQLLSAGVDHLEGHPIWAHAIPVATASGIHSVPMGQFATAALLMLVHRLPTLLEFKASCQWPDRVSLACSSLRGLVAGILGYGSIGRECARQWQALGVRILCLKRDPSRGPDEGFNGWPGTGDPEGRIPERWFGPDELRDFLPQCDVLLVTAPRTARTRGMIGPSELSLLKSTSRVIVISRGGLIDEDALAAALREGRLAGAAVDCFVREPLPETSPLFGAPNLVLTPHMSGVFDGYWPMALSLLCENLRRLARGFPLVNLARADRGY